MVLDSSKIQEDSDSETSSSERRTQHTQDSMNDELGLGLGRRLHISHLLQMVLQDAQTRLFFKAQAVVQSEVRYYSFKEEDLAWPDTLVGEPGF